jgi:two-component sensor histidine kinase
MMTEIKVPQLGESILEATVAKWSDARWPLASRRPAGSVLFDELNHRTKNNMQILQSLLMITARESHSLEVRAVLADASQRVAAMVASQAMLYHASNVTKCDSKEFLETIGTSVQRAFGKRITVLYEPASEQLPRDIVMPLALILNELLTNAVKYGTNSRGGGIDQGGTNKGVRILRAQCRG